MKKHETATQRKRRLQKAREAYKNKLNRIYSQGIRYSKNGRIRVYGCFQDICDCMEEGCEGCFMPCQMCKSQKCGPHCRSLRCFMYDGTDFDGSAKEFIPNPYLVN